MKSFNGIYKLGEEKVLGVDQSGINGDKTALCFARINGEKINVIRVELIEQQEEIQKLINRNEKEIRNM